VGFHFPFTNELITRVGLYTFQKYYDLENAFRNFYRTGKTSIYQIDMKCENFPFCSIYDFRIPNISIKNIPMCCWSVNKKGS